MKYILRISFLSTLLGLLACNTSKKLIQQEETVYETVVFDTMEIADVVSTKTKEIEPILEIYRKSNIRTMDLLHTKLEVSFDWEKEHLYGKAYLDLKPYFYANDHVVLDAKGFEILSIKNRTSGKELEYKYDGKKVNIQLEKSYAKEEIITLFIEYIAKPNEAPKGGSEAITSDKGLFFINANGKDPDKPQQIWTQGETEASSKWFPTIDSPNERCTQEIYITVQDKYITLSNGLLISSIKNSDNTRTDYWKMDLPHAPYLFMMTIGEYAKVDEQWEGIPLSYYVEPAYKNAAKEIYNNTPEMLTFFSKITGVKYPWPKFSQIVVRDYVSGAMENTTAVIFGEFVQKTSKELIDYNNDQIVAHEMFHHWFGDYVTCESWSNLTLNEGFANYAEYLWAEENQGRKAADDHKYQELAAYLQMEKNGGHDLIHYGYDRKEDMFDAHSYNKGGLVLHMLRDYVGDEAFFASLKKYLNDNAYTAVEADELRLAFEDVTGMDLNWFFNQWFFGKGHPILSVSQTYVDSSKVFKLTIKQTQNIEEHVPIFRLPIKLSFIYEDGRTESKEIWMNERKQTFDFENIGSDLVTVIVDKDDVLLIEKSHNKTDKQRYFEYLHNDTYLSKIEALSSISELKYLEKVVASALLDSYSGIKIAALNRFYRLSEIDSKSIEKLVFNDSSSRVRATALDVLSEIDNELAEKVSESILEKENSYIVINIALNIIGDKKPEIALKKAESLQNDQANSIKTKISNIFAKYGNANHISFFTENIPKGTRFGVFPLYNDFQKLLFRIDDKELENVVQNFLILQSKNVDINPIRRYLSTKTISIIKETLIERNKEATIERTNLIDQITKILSNIKSEESNEKIKAMYMNID